MRCYICDKYFYDKRDFFKLFNNSDNRLICDSCYNRYPIELNVEHIELEKYHAVIMCLFKHEYRINYNAYIYEYSKILAQYMKRDGYHTIFVDKLSLDDDSIEVLDAISKLNESNIIVVTFYVKRY